MKNYEDKCFKCQVLEKYEPDPCYFEDSDDPVQQCTQPSKQQTVLETTSPLLAQDELTIKKKLVRTSVHNQMQRILKGQTVQSQFSSVKSHTLPRQMPRYFADKRVRDACFQIPEMVSG